MIIAIEGVITVKLWLEAKSDKGQKIFCAALMS